MRHGRQHRLVEGEEVVQVVINEVWVQEVVEVEPADGCLESWVHQVVRKVEHEELKSTWQRLSEI